MDKCLVQKRQAKYKCHTPPWKETYRKRCQDRLKRSRGKFLDSIRCTAIESTKEHPSVVEDLMLEEWKILRSEQQGLPHLESPQANGEESYDEYWSIFEEIRAELIREEQQILREYEAGICHEEAALHHSVQQHLTDDLVICPVCQRNQLHINKGVVFCMCGVRIETEQDCITLPYIRHNLEAGVQLHTDACCPHAPHFGVVNQMSICNLIMSCQECDFMHIIV